MPRNPSVSIVNLVKRWLNSNADSYEVETWKELVVSIWWSMLVVMVYKNVEN